ncbi:MAG: dipeptidase [Clostridia bacterium]|nr:dipeptidase [Clostridia bacterium]
MYNLFDLHCDTATEMFAKKQFLMSNDLNISLNQRRNIEKYIQTFAFWTKEDENTSKPRFKSFTECYAYFMKECIKNSDSVTIIADKSDLEGIKSNGKTGIILSIEGGGVLEGKPENVEKLYKSGIKMITLTWNLKNELSGGVLDEVESGLTETGKSVIGEMERLGMIVDVSHISDKGFEDVCKTAKKPFIASHSNSRALCGHKRNITDDMFKEIVSRGGIVGINLYSKFLSEKEGSTVSDVLAHIDRFLKLGGEKTVAFGTDFDGVENQLPAELPKLENMHVMAKLLEQSYGKELAEDIMFNNANRFFLKHI